jgi:hypothetical protein
MSGGRPGIQFHRLPNLYDALVAEGARFVGRGRWPMTLCPFHDDHRPSLSVNRDGAGFLCRVCQTSGKGVLSFYSMRDGLSPVMVAQRFGALDEDPFFRSMR